MENTNLVWVIVGSVGSIMEGIAGVIALVAILFVLWQTREMTKQNRLVATATMASLYKDIASVMFEIDKIFIAEPELRPYFYDNIEISDQDERYQSALSLGEFFLDFMDLLIVLENVASEQTESVHIPWGDWKEYFKEIYCNSPILRKFWSEHGHWYSETLANLLNR